MHPLSMICKPILPKTEFACNLHNQNVVQPSFWSLIICFPLTLKVHSNETPISRWYEQKQPAKIWDRRRPMVNNCQNYWAEIVHTSRETFQNISSQFKHPLLPALRSANIRPVVIKHFLVWGHWKGDLNCWNTNWNIAGPGKRSPTL